MVLLLCFTGQFVNLPQILHCLSYHSFKIHLDINSINLPTLIFFQIVLAILGFFALPNKLQNQFVNFHQKFCWDFGFAFIIQDQTEKN